MAADHIPYDLLTRDALRGVVRAVLAGVAANGLPGDHHFYIAFDTRVDGVRLPDGLKASYPEEMTIVLQNRFWNLAVNEDHFEVSLTFNDVLERLHIPFRAVKAFVDPSVQFGLQFVVDAEAPTAAPMRPDAAGPAAAAGPEAEAAPHAAQDSGAEVVRLDRFRKK